MFMIYEKHKHFITWQISSLPGAKIVSTTCWVTVTCSGHYPLAMVHACTMAIVHAYNTAIVHECTMSIAHVSCPSVVLLPRRLGESFGWALRGQADQLACTTTMCWNTYYAALREPSLCSALVNPALRQAQKKHKK